MTATARVAKLRQARKDVGLIRVEVWVRPDDRSAIVALAATLTAPPQPGTISPSTQGHRAT
jgi:hypothetical protein